MGDRMEELKGRVKEGAGNLTGDHEMEAEGKGQAEGARAGRKIKGAVKEAAGSVKEGISKMTNDHSAEAEGKADRARGKAERTG